MTTALTPPEYEREIGKLKGRVSDLERILRDVTAGGRDHGIPFVLAGALAVRASPPWVPRFPSRAVDVIALLGTAGTSTTSLEIRRNGAAVGSGLALTAGETVKRFTISTLFAADVDRLTVAVTAAGAGAADLTVIVRFHGPDRHSR